ncbi:MAG TPA: hypothetical protein PLP01_10895 [Phycisphaerae bacterium]|nr:hypothetical protein [Phycisphaerae bacterium]
MLAARLAVCNVCSLRDTLCALWRLPDDRRQTILSDPRSACPVAAWTSETRDDERHEPIDRPV